MTKPQITPEFPIHEIFKKRWSPRGFKMDEIPPAHIQQCLEAARWTQSTSNSQPWNFVIARNGTETFNKILETLADGNKEWCKHAPYLMFNYTLDHNGRYPLGHSKYDLGAAINNFGLQAIELDIYIHQMAGFDSEAAHKAFELADDQSAATVAAFGYLGDTSNLSEGKAAAEYKAQERKPQSEFVELDL